MKTFIYILIDPITNQIRYVGKSLNPKERLRKHITEAKNRKYINHKNNWLISLINQNLFPVMEIIDEIDGDWIWLEQYWISQFKTWGFELVNSTDGGENPPSFKDKTHSDNYKEIRKNYMLLNNPAKNMSDDWRKNIGLAHKLNDFIPTKAIEANMKEVYQYTLDNVFIQLWPSLTEAAKGIGHKRISGISAVCNNKRPHAGGFKWKYKN